MGYKRTSKESGLEDRIQEAIIAYKNHGFTSIRAAANHFDVSHVTVTYRMAGRKSRA